MKITGIYRARRFSPASVENDRLIMDEVLRLFADGNEVTAVNEEELVERGEVPVADLVLTMARSDEALQLLRLCKGRVVNAPDGIDLCNRRYMLEQLLAEGNIPLPPHEGTDGVWLKRGDATAQVPEDTVFCLTPEEEAKAMEAFRERGIEYVVRQAHVAGDLVKFYGVGGTDFFHTLYPTDTGRSKFGSEVHNGKAHHYAYDTAALKQTTDRIAVMIGVAVYGGDAIVRADGSFVIIDFNDWPTFSPCREQAAWAIQLTVNSEQRLAVNSDVI